jgi:hypothetical protein
MEYHTEQILSKYPKDIKKLDISNKGIKGVLDLNGYHIITELDCSNNEITKIKNIISYEIKFINCSNNKISKLYELPNSLEGINYSGNPITKMLYPFNVLPQQFPENLKELTFGTNFNQPIKNLYPKGCSKNSTDECCPCCPNTITYLGFDFHSKYNLPLNNLPSSLIYLKTSNKFNHPINNLPPNLMELTLGYDFNQPINNLPTNLKHLIIIGDFNQMVDNLPNSITHLQFGCDFNQKVDNLPTSLTHLTFGYDFNQSVDNLPNNLTHLTFGRNFNQLTIYQLV